MTFLYHLFNSYFAKGGTLMIFIFGVSVVASYIGLEKLLYLNRFHKARLRYLDLLAPARTLCKISNENATGVKEFDKLLEKVQDHCMEPSTGCSVYLTFREFLISAVPEVDKGLSTMSAWISVAPLLGLLGTVGGMIETFRVITDYGLGNPNLTAEGISIALITTQAGLTVAFPMVLFHNYLCNKAKDIKNTLFKDGEELVNLFAAVNLDKNGEKRN